MIITDDNPHPITEISELFDTFNPDHYPIIFSLKNEIASSKTDTPKKIMFRNLKQIDLDSFSKDISDSLSIMNNCKSKTSSFSDTIAIYNTQCLSTIDKHAPVLKKLIKERSSAPWFDGEYKSIRTKRRKAEKKWKNSKLESDKNEYHRLRIMCNELALEKKKVFIKGSL